MGKFSEDVRRYRATGDSGRQLWTNFGLWTVAVYRFSHWLNVEKPPAILRISLKPLAFFLWKLFEAFFGMRVNPQASIGPGLRIAHSDCVHIGPHAVIGKNCDIAHNVTIGAAGFGRIGDPTLGDNVFVGTGATLIGNIRIGNHARIAANTLVTRDVPDGATAMGVPAQIVKIRSIEDLSSENFRCDEALQAKSV
jgi:serine O-acetyltransferase